MQPDQPTPPPLEPIIIDIREPTGMDAAGFVDVLLGALGLAGMVTLLAVTLGAILGGFMFWRHWRAD